MSGQHRCHQLNHKIYHKAKESDLKLQLCVHVMYVMLHVPLEVQRPNKGCPLPKWTKKVHSPRNHRNVEVPRAEESWKFRDSMCSRLLTFAYVCSRFAHATWCSFYVLTVPFGVLDVLFWSTFHTAHACSRLLTFAHGLVSGLGPQKGDESRPNNTFLLRSETSKSTWPVDVEFVPFEVVVYGNP